IPMLAHHFLAEVCTETGKQVSGFSADVLPLLQSHAMPGNVRELRNIVERAVLLGKGSVILREDLPTDLHEKMPVFASQSSVEHRTRKTLKEAMEGPERQFILDVLNGTNWCRNQTAYALGINRTTLYKKMKKLGLQEPRFLTGHGVTERYEMNPANL
ncbi:MAG: hypothetical protein N2C12_05955, partial [Planctomycetales bacterium]